MEEQQCAAGWYSTRFGCMPINNTAFPANDPEKVGGTRLPEGGNGKWWEQLIKNGGSILSGGGDLISGIKGNKGNNQKPMPQQWQFPQQGSAVTASGKTGVKGGFVEKETLIFGGIFLVIILGFILMKSKKNKG